MAESNDYAYENVLVAICELRQRDIDIPQADIDSFCIKYRLPGIEAGLTDFFRGNNVRSYEEYYRKGIEGSQRVPPQQESYQRPVMQRDPVQQMHYGTVGGNSSIRDAGSSLIAAGISVVVNFVLTVAVGMYWPFKMADVAAGKETPGSLFLSLMIQAILLLLGFGAVVYHLIRAGMKLREA